jgi:hypothetical protein
LNRATSIRQEPGEDYQICWTFPDKEDDNLFTLLGEERLVKWLDRTWMKGLMLVPKPKGDKRGHWEELAEKELEHGGYLPELDTDEETAVRWMRVGQAFTHLSIEKFGLGEQTIMFLDVQPSTYPPLIQILIYRTCFQWDHCGDCSSVCH